MAEGVFLLVMILFICCFVRLPTHLTTAKVKVLAWSISILFIIQLSLELISSLISLKTKKKDSKKIHPENSKSQKAHRKKNKKEKLKIQYLTEDP